MPHKEVLERFKKFCNIDDVLIDRWFPNGKNSVRVRLRNHFTDLVFTFKSHNNWKLETVNSFIDSM